MKLYRDFVSQEEIDREYNAGAAIPDMERWLAWFADESAQARVELECELDLRFGPTMDETVDIFPARQSGATLLLFIHGGYWRWGSSKDFSLVARGLANHGITVAVTNYSLCPKVTISEITRQNRAALAWLYNRAPGFNADPDRIFIAGHSAGGQQVGMLTATDWPGEYDLPGDIVKGAIPISGVFDLQPLRYSYLQPKLLLTHEIIRHQSPYFNIPAAGPPQLVTLGGDESAEFHRQSRDYLKAWQARGFSGELFIQEGKHHLAAIDGFVDPHSPLCSRIIDFMARTEKALT